MFIIKGTTHFNAVYVNSALWTIQRRHSREEMEFVLVQMLATNVIIHAFMPSAMGVGLRPEKKLLKILLTKEPPVAVQEGFDCLLLFIVCCCGC
jgi:hypothetical protein